MLPRMLTGMGRSATASAARQIRSYARGLNSMDSWMQTSMLQRCPTPRAVRQDYDQNGWAEMEFAATQEELGQIRQYIDDRVKSKHPGNIYDDAGELRAVHGYEYGWNPTIMNRFAARALSMLGCESVYVYQFRVNIKCPSKVGAGTWSLHRDFDFWHGMDGMPQPNAVAFHVLVSDHTEENGPLIFVDGSHNMDVQIDSKKDDSWQAGFQESGLKYTIDESLVGNAQTRALTGPEGTVCAMNALTWHYSRPNLSSSNRVLLSVILNDTSNLPVQPKGTIRRPHYIVCDPMDIWTAKPEATQPCTHLRASSSYTTFRQAVELQAP